MHFAGNELLDDSFDFQNNLKKFVYRINFLENPKKNIFIFDS